MDWIVLSLLSALGLGFYDVAKKQSVRDNAVPAVLWINVGTAAAIWGPFVLASFLVHDSETRLSPLAITDLWLHLALLGKANLVGLSWMLAFFALKHLPISIATPIRATSPCWTILLAVLLMHERPSVTQWIGLVIVVVAFLLFSRIGLREGIRFARNRWVALMIGATLIGAVCGLYDKVLLQRLQLSPATVQAWFSIYLVPVMTPLAVYWFRYDRKRVPFQWRWSIPCIAIMLLIADFAYFTALSNPDALVSVVSPLRRASVVIPFTFGILGLREANWRPKLACLVAILIGVVVLAQS